MLHFWKASLSSNMSERHALNGTNQKLDSPTGLAEKFVGNYLGIP